MPCTFGQANNSAPRPASDDAATVRVRAEAGDAQAQTDLGLRYIEGSGVQQDYNQAAQWLKKAAMQGDAQGQLELGVMFVNGEGVPEDAREGYAWYWLSSQQGNETAKGYLDDLNRSLSQADRDKAKARAAELSKLIEASRSAKPRHGQHRPSSAATSATPVAGTPKASAPAAGPQAKAVPGAATSQGGHTFTEGKDYTVWQRVRIKDQNGFGQPVEAYSILLPKGWRTEGQVSWVINASCPADAVQNRVTAVSPDGAFRLEVFPQRNWQWFDDPMMLQNAQNSARMGYAGCALGPPYEAGQYMQQVFVPTDLRGAQLVSHRPNEAMARAMQEQAQRNNATFRAAGVNLESRPSAEIGQLRFPDGQVGIVLCAVEQTVASMPNLLNGGRYASYQCRATVKTMLSGPAGREEETERILGTVWPARVRPGGSPPCKGCSTTLPKSNSRRLPSGRRFGGRPKRRLATSSGAHGRFSSQP
ncbi:MAG: tetratricopeptide repeat protein [Verrucomicrobiota bacterium]